MANVNNKVKFAKMRSVFFFSLIILLSVIILYLIRPFFYPIFWAAVLAVMFYPIYKGVVKYVKRQAISSFITILIVILTIFIPLTLITYLIVNASFDLYNAASKNVIFTNPEQVSSWLQHSFLGPYIDQIRNQWAGYISSVARTLGEFLFTNIMSFTQNSVKFLFMLFIMFYTLFFFFKDGKRILQKIMHISPLGDTYEEMLYNRFTSTARATLKSTILVGGLQGILAGLLFWITGIQGAIIWGLITMICALIPALGSFIVWAPIGVISLALGNTWQGIVILLFGFLVVSTIDNFLKPIMVGKDAQMHPLIVLFSTLGGVVLFGISGFVIGPVVAALYLSIISIYEHYYKEELSDN